MVHPRRFYRDEERNVVAALGLNLLILKKIVQGIIPIPNVKRLSLKFNASFLFSKKTRHDAVFRDTPTKKHRCISM